MKDNKLNKEKIKLEKRLAKLNEKIQKESNQNAYCIKCKSTLTKINPYFKAFWFYFSSKKKVKLIPASYQDLRDCEIYHPESFHNGQWLKTTDNNYVIPDSCVRKV